MTECPRIIGTPCAVPAEDGLAWPWMDVIYHLHNNLNKRPSASPIHSSPWSRAVSMLQHLLVVVIYLSSLCDWRETEGLPSLVTRTCENNSVDSSITETNHVTVQCLCSRIRYSNFLLLLLLIYGLDSRISSFRVRSSSIGKSLLCSVD